MHGGIICPLSASYFSIKYINMQNKYLDMQNSYMSTCNKIMMTCQTCQKIAIKWEKKLKKKKRNSSKISNTAQMLLIIIFVEMQVISNLYCKLNMMTMLVKFLCQHANQFCQNATYNIDMQIIYVDMRRKYVDMQLFMFTCNFLLMLTCNS